MHELVAKLTGDFPNLRIEPSDAFRWSPRQKLVTYRQTATNSPVDTWSLFHELGHAVANHKTYQTDLELLMMEVEAWHSAKEVGKLYGVEIDEEHIQDCLDTYRDWLDQRSTCPICGNAGVQHTARQYNCFNCGTDWQVSASRFCRPYRRTVTRN